MMRMMVKGVTCAAATCMLSLAGLAAGTSVSLADSCWDHNGSIMRLQADGNKRWFYYENPRQVVRDAGVTPGTLLFDGVKDGNWYSGTARVFSKFCPGDPLEYFVEGPVRGDQLEVTVSGTREVHKNCQPTGQTKTDVLVFTYAYDC